MEKMKKNIYTHIYRYVYGASQVALVVKNLLADAGHNKRCGFNPSGKFPGGEYGSPLQYSCLENPMDRGTWWAI